MKKPFPFEKASTWLLFFFAATAVIAIFWQHSIWVAILFWLIAWAKGRVHPAWPKGPLVPITWFFMATFFISAALGVHPSQSFGTVHRDLTFLLFFLVGAMEIDLPRVQKLLLYFTHGAAFCGLWGITKHVFFHEGRITSFVSHYMIFGGLLMTALVLQSFFLLREPRSPRHWGITLILAVALLLTKTRGSWLGCLVGLVLLLWIFRKKWLLPALLLLLASFFLLPQGYQNRVRSIWDPAAQTWDPKAYNSNIEREMMWRAGWAMSKDYPLFGVGQGNINEVYPKYKDPSAKGDIPHLHDNFVQILAENGWVGLLAYLIWIVAYSWESLKRRTWPTEARDWNLVLFCAFWAGIVWGLTEYTFSHQFMNVQFFLIALQANLWNLGKTKASKK